MDSEDEGDGVEPEVEESEAEAESSDEDGPAGGAPAAASSSSRNESARKTKAHDNPSSGVSSWRNKYTHLNIFTKSAKVSPKEMHFMRVLTCYIYFCTCLFLNVICM